MDDKRRFSAFLTNGRDPSATIVEALEFARDYLPHCSLEERSRVKAVIIIEELVSNVLRHQAGNRDIALVMTLTDNAGTLSIEIEDDGESFDPTSSLLFDGPDPNSGGGVGLAIIRAWADAITYARNGERNFLRVTLS